MSGKVWSWVRNGFALGVALWLGWSFSNKHLVSVWHGVVPGWLIVALGAASITIWIRAAKWHLLLSEDRIPASQGESARSLLGAYALGSITPGRLGDYARCIFVGEGRRSRTLLLTFVDKALDSWAVVSVGIVSLFLLLPHTSAILVSALWFGLIPAGFLASKTFRGGRPPGSWVFKLIRTFQGLRKIHLRRFAGWAVAASCLDVVTLLCLLEAFHKAGWAVALAAYPCLVIAGAVPVSFGGIGPREGVSALLLPVFSISSALAVNISLAFFAFTILLPAIVGAVWLAARPPKLERHWWRSLVTPFRHKGESPLVSLAQQDPTPKADVSSPAI